MLISAVLPIMSLYKLPHGQYAYSGHVINLPQDVASFANSLPRLPSELDVIIVRKEGATDSHRDFRVRRAVVLRALQWLIANNKYYRNVHINPDALAMLPENGNLSGIHSVTLNSSDEDTASPTLDEDEDPYNTHLSGSLCSEHHSADDRTGDGEAHCAGATISPSTSSSSPNSSMASQ